jgi:hypothetical protein
MTLRRSACWLVLGAVLLSWPAPARASTGKVVVFDLENRTDLGQGEAEFLSKAVVSSMLDLTADGYQIVRAEQVAGCDAGCLAGEAMAQGAAHFVAGQIVDFGEGRAVSLDLYRTDGPVVLAAETTPPAVDPADLIQAAKEATGPLKARLRSLAAPAPEPGTVRVQARPAQRPAGRSAPVVPPSGNTGTLVVTSTPNNAKVWIGGTQGTLGAYAGTTPLSKQLLPRKYWLRTKADGYDMHMKAIAIFSRETYHEHIVLTPSVLTAIKSSDPEERTWGRLIVAGHSLAWPGLAVVAVAIAMLVSEDVNQTGRTVIAGTGAAVFGTGLTLLVAGSRKKRKALEGRRNSPRQNW